MYEQVNEGEFIQRFVLLDRKENFSYEGRKALFEYFEQLEEDTDQKIEFDCIAICCEYSEYQDIKEFEKDYPKVLTEHRDDYSDREAYKNALMEEIRDKTEVIEIEGTDRFLIRQF